MDRLYFEMSRAHFDGKGFDGCFEHQTQPGSADTVNSHTTKSRRAKRHLACQQKNAFFKAPKLTGVDEKRKEHNISLSGELF